MEKVNQQCCMITTKMVWVSECFPGAGSPVSSWIISCCWSRCNLRCDTYGINTLNSLKVPFDTTNKRFSNHSKQPRREISHINASYHHHHRGAALVSAAGPKHVFHLTILQQEWWFPPETLETSYYHLKCTNSESWHHHESFCKGAVAFN